MLACDWLKPREKKDQFIKSIPHKKALTICIATICEANTNSPKIVFCADRMLTDQYGYTFELQRPKILQLATHCLVMEAGDASIGNTVIQHFNKRVPLGARETMNVLEIARKLIEEARKDEIARERRLRKYSK